MDYMSEMPYPLASHWVQLVGSHIRIWEEREARYSLPWLSHCSSIQAVSVTDGCLVFSILLPCTASGFVVSLYLHIPLLKAPWIICAICFLLIQIWRYCFLIFISIFVFAICGGVCVCVSTWLGHGVPSHLVKHYSGCVCEDVSGWD